MSIGWPGCHGSAALSLTACAGVAELDLGVRGGARVAAQRAGGWNWRWCTGGALARLEAAQRWSRSGRWCGRRAAARWSRGEARARRGKGIIGEEKEKRGGACCWSAAALDAAALDAAALDAAALDAAALNAAALDAAALVRSAAWIGSGGAEEGGAGNWFWPSGL